MVCFCDIPLTMTSEHIEHYNGFAIGLKKEWGIGHGLNPVLIFFKTGNSIVKYITRQKNELLQKNY